jgi:hypothetical protein
MDSSDLLEMVAEYHIFCRRESEGILNLWRGFSSRRTCQNPSALLSVPPLYLFYGFTSFF